MKNNNSLLAHYPIYLLIYDITHVNQFTGQKPYSCWIKVCKSYDFAYKYQPIQWVYYLLNTYRMYWIDEISLFDSLSGTYTTPEGKPDLNIALQEEERLKEIEIEKTKKGQLNLIT